MRPNILFITADQLRQDCIGCYGNTVIRTPHIDRLAQDGIIFQRAYTAATLCVPSRQSILTGQYPSKHGSRGNRSAIPEGTTTFVSVLGDAGYNTAAFGKMHFHPTYADYGFDIMKLAEQDGDGRFKDDYHQYLAGQGLHDKWDEWDQIAEKRAGAPPDYWESYGAIVSEIPEEHYHSTWIANQTIEYIKNYQEESPFFAWMSFIKPHHPFDPPAPYDNAYSPDEVIIPQASGGWEEKPLLTAGGEDPRIAYFDTRKMTESELRRVIALYYGMIEHIDVQIGRVIDSLEQKGLKDNTLIVFTSDHGDYLGEHGLFLKHPNIPYDALARVPLIFSGADVKPSEQAIKTPVSLIDLASTFTGLAGCEPLPLSQGIDLNPILSGKSLRVNRKIYCENDGATRAVITEGFKYIYDGVHEIGEIYAFKTTGFDESQQAQHNLESEDIPFDDKTAWSDL